MKRSICLALAVACCLGGAGVAQSAAPAPEAAPALLAPVPAATPATGPAARTLGPLGVAAAPLAAPPIAALPAASAGGLWRTILALLFVLTLLGTLAWLLKRYGPQAAGGGGTVRLVGSLSLGGRERIIVVEVADQWIVVGAAPGRVNALATMARQAGPVAAAAHGLPATNFADWLKQTLEKRNGK